MCDCDYNRPTIYEQTSHVARKPHRCCECRRVIRPGEKYNACFGVWDGDANRYKWCENCQALWETMHEAGLCACFGELFVAAGEDGIACHVSWKKDLVCEGI